MSGSRTPIEKMIDEACGVSASPSENDERILFAAQLEALCQEIESSEEARCLRLLLPAVRSIRNEETGK